jgi:GxxExxY protein
MDIVVEDRLVRELKTLERLLPVHEAQPQTYLKLSRLGTGVLLNFNTPVLQDAIKRMIL